MCVCVCTYLKCTRARHTPYVTCCTIVTSRRFAVARETHTRFSLLVGTDLRDICVPRITQITFSQHLQSDDKLRYAFAKFPINIVLPAKLLQFSCGAFDCCVFATDSMPCEHSASVEKIPAYYRLEWWDVQVLWEDYVWNMDVSIISAIPFGGIIHSHTMY